MRLSLSMCVYIVSLRADSVRKSRGGGCISVYHAGRPGSSEVPRNPRTRWDVSSTPANGIFLT